jgi:hypothetical protein
MTKQELVGSNTRLAVAVFLTGFASFASYQLHLAMGREWAGDELIPIFVGPVGFIAVFLIVLTINFVFRAPYEQWGALEARVTDLERRLRPAISVLAVTNHRPSPIDYGQTLLTHGGRRTTNQKYSPQDYLRLDITNESACTLEGCEAYLTRLERLDVEQEPQVWFAMRLPWLPVGSDEQAVADIPRGGIRSVILFRVIANHVHLVEYDQVPIHMVRALNERGEYQGLVTISAKNAPSAFIAFDLSCYGPDASPILTVRRNALGGDEDGGWARETPIV